MIEAKGLTKRYGATVAVDNLSFEVKPGKVTGFLGPNGAGKSTTMRMILGLDTPTAGEVTIDGQRYRDLILSKGHTQDYGPMFRAFYGKDPDIGPMLEHRGLTGDRD